MSKYNQELTISPQSLGDDVLALLADTNIRHLYIVQNSYTPVDIKPCSWQAWKSCREINGRLQVHLRNESAKGHALVWQEYAPVYSVLFDSSKIMVSKSLNNIN